MSIRSLCCNSLLISFLLFFVLFQFEVRFLLGLLTDTWSQRIVRFQTAWTICYWSVLFDSNCIFSDVKRTFCPPYFRRYCSNPCLFVYDYWDVVTFQWGVNQKTFIVIISAKKHVSRKTTYYILALEHWTSSYSIQFDFIELEYRQSFWNY